MLKNHQTRRIYGSRQYHIATSLGFSILTFLFAFITSFLIGSHFAPVSDGSASSDISTFLDSETGYYLSTTSLGNVILDVVSTPSGQTVVGKDTLTTKTNSSTGYKLYISMDKSAEDDRNGNRLYRNGDSSSGYYLSPSTGAITSPLKLATNTWGYALGSSVTIPAHSAGNSTDSDVTVPAYTGSTGTIEADAADNALFMAVPLRGNESLIQSYDQASSTGIPLDVYYGVNANTALPSGLYTGTVYYTAIAEGEPAASGEVSVSPVSEDGNTGGKTLTIATGLYTTMSDIGDVTITVGGNNCTDITRTNPDSALVSFTCVTPSTTTLGAKDVVVSIPKFGKTYTLEDGYTYEYPSFYTISTMQEMTHETCASVSAPTLDTMTTVLTKDGTDGTTAWTADAAGTPQIVLEDVRDRTNGEVGTGTMYTVRKFADNKCWMARNLRYAPATATTLSADTSDVLDTNTWQMPALGTVNGTNVGNKDANGDEVYEGSYGSTYDATYYSWHTATAGTGTTSVTSENTTQSICPKNWRLPTSGVGDGTTDITTTGSSTNIVDGDFYQLNASFGGQYSDLTRDQDVINRWKDADYGWNLQYIGFYGGSTIYWPNAHALWWSSTPDDDDESFSLRICDKPGDCGPRLDNHFSMNKGFSFAIRCVAR